MQQLFDIKQTQIKMVRDRGFVVEELELAFLNMTLEQFDTYISREAFEKKLPKRALLTRAYQNADKTRSMLVYYGSKLNPSQKQVPISVIQDFIRLIKTYGITESILILDAPPSSPGSNSLKALTTVKWQIFYDEEMVYSPVEHVDTPRHVLLSPQETVEKLREMKTDIGRLLIIKESDPVVKYYGWPVGGLVCIYRDDSVVSVLAPKSINYRVIMG